ncbi:LOW QUALITY PROTEIN: DNA ligase 4 [Macrosteles quadrilineatus]|uniref:LOW QUALITY PROTEIN: DNA ligase 4 n=1 Tax=Macrosteles quadrilineatus TaxID=74068 RepID=UPI0023E10887|nr:LOW QUALITY PROTEIN: DNA ligase 4 [Macrosteles quadrilineatus]
MMFYEFSDICEKISLARRDKRVAVLQKFISDYRSTNPTSFYPVLRLLLPKFDRQRDAYGIKETVLARIYIRILCLHPDSTDALKLKNFRAPKNAGDSAGDFGDVAYWVLRSRCSTGRELSMDDVHRHLDNIALHHADRKPRDVDRELEAMLHRMTALEQKWLIRIVLKDMKLGLGTKRILSVYHPDAQEVYDFTHSLQQVCEKLTDPTQPLHEVEVTLFNSCHPMLAVRCDVQNISRYFYRRPGPRYVETKMDGERSQLHYADGQFKFFSRNGYEFTDAFGSNEATGSITPYLIKQFKSGVKNCILDGEMMPWNTKYRCFGTKGMNLDVKSLRVGNVHQPCFCVFDLLYLNGAVLTNRPLSDRLAALEQVFTPCEGIFISTPRTVVNNGEEVLQELNLAIDRLEEGIVVKDPNSIYKPNSRKEDWIKIKPEYTAGAMVELDLLIVGGYYGGGRRRGLISHFLLGVAQPPPDGPGGVPVVFESVTRVGSGCTLDELSELSRKLEPHWRRTKPGYVPPSHLWTRERPELWLEPMDSVIVQVKASEVVPSDFYQTGFTLRFPRIEKVRYDKPWSDCLTTVEFTRLRESAYGSLVNDHITQQSPRARKRRAPRDERSIGTQFLNNQLHSVSSLSQMLNGLEICVLTGTPEMSKQQLELKVKESGGTVVLNPGKTTYCVIVGEENNIRVTNVLKKGSYNVIRASWLVHSLDAGQRLSWTPRDMISAAPDTAVLLAQQFDQYGDSYTDPANLDSLKHTMAQVGKKDISLKQMVELDKILFNKYSPFSVFRGCVACFDCPEEDSSAPKNDSLRMLRYDFEFHGGEVTSDLTPQTTHIILNSSDLERLEEWIIRSQALDKTPYIVQHHWITQCVSNNTRVDEYKYLLHLENYDTN